LTFFSERRWLTGAAYDGSWKPRTCGYPGCPAAFAPFALFPVWVTVVAAVVARRMHVIDSQKPAKD
jgi:hypothetical protein